MSCGITFDTNIKQIIYPWIDLNGNINQDLYNKIKDQLIIHLLENPGILEDHLCEKMSTFNKVDIYKIIDDLINENKINYDLYKVYNFNLDYKR